MADKIEAERRKARLAKALRENLKKRKARMVEHPKGVASFPDDIAYRDDAYSMNQPSPPFAAPHDESAE